jgi:hypothetical protein
MEDEQLSPSERARIRARDRKAQPPRMVVDNAGVKRIQIALQNRAQVSKRKRKARD